ncbi:MAG: hypothetical protein EXS15_07680 [Phycisphaerales bacterium]|nr:hypothetical protein [Phycisphaerales bacterium]
MLAIVLTVCLGPAFGFPSQSPSAVSVEEGARIRWANAVMREACLAVSPSDLSLAEIEASIFMSRMSALLQPDNPERWRVVLGLSAFAGDAMPYAVEVGREAVLQLARLCPDDQVIRLRRILLEIDRSETADERAQAFRRFLTPEAIRAIQTPVASRLFFDLALFEWRVGDIEAFAADLTHSLALSPAFPSAADTAAGFISERIVDPIAECELLVAVVMSNPIDERSWSRLGALLLQEGAYDSAARVYRTAAQVAKGKAQMMAVCDMITVDYALALWGAGRSSDAIQAMKQYIADAKLMQAALIQTYNPNLTREQCDGVPFLMPRLVATIDAAVRVSLRDPTAPQALDTMIAAALAQAKREDPDTSPEKVAQGSLQAQEMLETSVQTLLDSAMAAILLDARIESVQSLIDFAKQKLPLSEEAVIRFDGWKALKGGDATAALALLNTSPSISPVMEMIRAKALVAQGDRRGAATKFMAIASHDRGSLIGLLAAHELKSIIGVALPAAEPVAELNAVVASIPPIVEKYIVGSERPITFQVEPVDSVIEPFDPIVYRLTLTNDASFPMSITLGGPIKQHVLLQPRMSQATKPGVDRLMPQIIPIDRAIELASGESISMLWDFGWTEVGLRIGQDPIAGGTIGIRGATNFIAEAGSFSAGPMGVEPFAKSVQVNGIRTTPEWVAAAIASARAPTTDHDLVQYALLIHAGAQKLLPDEVAASAWQALVVGFPKLPPHAQAWVLFAAPHNVPEFEPVLDIARATTSGDVRAAYLLSFCITQDDAQVAAGLRSDDPFARLAASVFVDRVQREIVRGEERMRGEARNANVGARDKVKSNENTKAARDAKQATPP